MFSANSPKLPIGATFEATIEPSPKGSSLLLNIEPESVRLIESVEAQTEEHSENQSKSMTKKQHQTNLSQLLKDAIYEVYEQTGETEFQVGNWTAKVSNARNNLRCLVKDEDENAIFAADLKTGRIIKELSEVNSDKFVEQLLEATPESTKREVAEAEI